MTDHYKEENRTPKAESELQTPPMAETEEKPQEPQKPDKPNVSFSIWPPTERTRDAVVKRLIETLSTPSVLSKQYGTIAKAEAIVTARRIEEEAFSSASASASTDDDGIEILQGYSKEISKRMLETVKSRSGSASEPAAEGPAACTTTSEEIPSVESEAN